ncbi:MAG: hypothetical protein V3U82_00300 [Robiginitomaculum sp.]
MKYYAPTLLALMGFAIFVTPFASAQTTPPPVDFDARHDTCLELVSKDAELGYEEALIWKGDGGGRRARHCIATALFVLGHEGEAAARLEAMGAEISLGTPPMRATWLAQSADFWMEAGEAEFALRAADTALETVQNNLSARLIRARAYAKLGHLDYAEIDLTSALTLYPGNVAALRARADMRRQLGKLSLASADIEQALRGEPNSVETALMRGKIREAIRLAALELETDK